jgi:Nucleoside-diphosphate-sugar epimerases
VRHASRCRGFHQGVENATSSRCVIGGSGFIGSHLVNALVEMGKDVRIATRRRYNARHLTLLPIDVIEADVFDPVQLARFVEGADCVINLVATLHGKRGTPYGPEFARAHVELPTKIVAACEGKGVHRLIHISCARRRLERAEHVFASKGDGEKAVHAANLAWTIFRRPWCSARRPVPQQVCVPAADVPGDSACDAGREIPAGVRRRRGKAICNVLDLDAAAAIPTSWAGRPSIPSKTSSSIAAT